MFHYFLSVFSLVFLLLLFGACIAIGRRVGKSHLKEQKHPKLEIVGVAESSVFGLLALLIAFTFSGAYDRYETRKMELVEEANTFDKAYNYIDLFPEKLQESVRVNMREYFECYIHAFNYIPHSAIDNKNSAKAQILEDQIWADTVAAANTDTKQLAFSQVYIVAFNDMIEIAHKGYYITQIHPPGVIFLLLVILAALGAFLVGYTSSESKQFHPLHSICYVFLTAFTIYIIINMEFPRAGFIGLDIFDQFLWSVRANMD